MAIAGQMLLPGQASGPVLRLEAPISFWGGVDPASGHIVDPRHPQHGASVAGTVLLVPATVGSSSSSSVLLELIAGGQAPAAIALGKTDAILCLGAVVAIAMGWTAPPVVALDAEKQRVFAPGSFVRLTADGVIHTTASAD
ncbi:MAG: DUF126 domain-containing protein [Pseudomonadota bacterium]